MRYRCNGFWRGTFFVALAMLAAVAVGQEQTSKLETQLRSAGQKELVDGDLKGAIAAYQKVLAAAGSNKDIAARALVEMGRLYEKLGADDAQKTYERVLREYSDQGPAAAEAQARLRSITAPSSAGFAPKGLSRLVNYGTTTAMPRWETITPDGRYLIGGANVAAGNGGIKARDLATQQERVIAEKLGMVEGIAVSASGKEVAFSYSSGTETQIRITPFEPRGDAKPTVIFSSSDFLRNKVFGWSRDSTTVFTMLTRKDYTHQIAAVSVSNGSPRILKSLEHRWPNRLSVSPDGRYIAYDAPVLGDTVNRDIFLLRADGSSEAELVQSPARDALPVWTPDGAAVIYTSDQDGTLGLWMIQVVHGKPRGKAELVKGDVAALWPLGFAENGAFYYATEDIRTTDIQTLEVNIDTAAVIKQPVRLSERTGRNFAPAFSPDGRSLAYFSVKRASFMTSVSNPVGYLSIIVRALSTGQEREVPTTFTRASSPMWSVDNSLVFIGETDGGYSNGLHRVDLQTGKDLIDRVIHAQWASVSPDGRTIYYLSSESVPRLVAYDLASQRETELRQGRADALAVSPDGKDIAVVVGRKVVLTSTSADASPREIFDSGVALSLSTLIWSADSSTVTLGVLNSAWRIPTDGQPVQRIGANNFVIIEALAPNRSLVAYGIGGRAQASRQVWVDPDLLRPDDGGNIFLAPLDKTTGKVRGPAVRLNPEVALWDQAPVWSPDGKSVAFKRKIPGETVFDLVVRSLSGGEERTLTSPPRMTGGGNAVWLPDGKGLLTGSTGGLYRFDLTSGEAAPITGIAAVNRDVSPDGRTMYQLRRDTANNQISIASIDLATGRQQQTPIQGFINELNGPFRLMLSPDGRTLAFVHREVGACCRLARVEVDGSGYRQLGSTGSNPITQGLIAWMRDGRSILFGEIPLPLSPVEARIMRIPAAGGQAEFTGLTLRGVQTYDTIDVSPDGSRLLFSAGSAIVSAK